MQFKKWLDTFVDEKEIDREAILEVEGPSGLNCIPVGCLLEAMFSTTPREQASIKATIVKIDFVNGDVLDYFRHLAQAIAQ